MHGWLATNNTKSQEKGDYTTYVLPGYVVVFIDRAFRGNLLLAKFKINKLHSQLHF